MKRALLPILLLLSACVSQRTATPPPGMVVKYQDLALGTPAGRANLVARVDRAARSFCAAYDPTDGATIFDVHLASPSHCPGRAILLLLSKAPAAVRRAYRAGAGNEQDASLPPDG